MLFAKLFARRDSRSTSRSLGQTRRPAAPRRRPHRLPHVELLEDRTLLSGWVVDAVGTVDDPSGFSVATDSTGNVYVAGNFVGTATLAPGVTLTSAGSSDVLVAKYSSAGTLLWAKRAGGTGVDTGFGIALDASGNVYVAGNFADTADFGSTTLTAAGGSTDSDIFVTKLDGSAGSFLWAKSAGGAAVDSARSITVGPGANVYAIGSFSGTASFGTTSLTSAGFRDIVVWSLDTNGNSVWAQRAGGTIADDWGTGIAADGSGVYTTGWFRGTATFGSTSLTSAGYGDIFVSKLDLSGNFVWANRMGTAADGDRGWAITVDAASNLFVTGALDNWGLGSAFVTKLDNIGNTVWTKTFGASSQADVCNTGNPTGRGIAIDGAGNVYTAGYFRGTADFDPGSGVAYLTSTSPSADNVFVSKLDSSGGFVSARRMGGAGGARAFGFAVDGLGNMYATGDFSGTADFDTGTSTVSLTASASTDIFVSATTQDRGAIFGQVFDDLGNNGTQDIGDTGLAGRTVYMDQNNNGVLDSGEPSTTTGPAGEYRFMHLVAGTYVVRQVVPSGWSQTHPAGSAAQTVVLSTAQFVDGQDFGEFNPSVQAGWFWGEGGCKDLQTGLVWSPDTTILSSWLFWSGMQHALDLSQNGFSDWRNATIVEMQTAFAHGAPTVGVGPGGSELAWSMSLTGRKSFNVPTAWDYNFTIGTASEAVVSGSIHQILVRGGSSVYFVDDGGPGYSDTGGWTVVSGQGQEGDYRYRAKGNGSAQATWSFTGLTAGTYQVQTTWVPLATNAKNAPYKIYNGATLLGQVSVNQQKPPSTTIYSSATIPWKTLGNFTITGTTLNVILNNNASGTVQADMVRLVPISPTAVAAVVATRETHAAGVDAAIASHYNDDHDSRRDLLREIESTRDLLQRVRGFRHR